jgi:hypothetical protein
MRQAIRQKTIKLYESREKSNRTICGASLQPSTEKKRNVK